MARCRLRQYKLDIEVEYETRRCSDDAGTRSGERERLARGAHHTADIVPGASVTAIGDTAEEL